MVDDLISAGGPSADDERGMLGDVFPGHIEVLQKMFLAPLAGDQVATLQLRSEQCETICVSHHRVRRSRAAIPAGGRATELSTVRPKR